MRESRKNFGNSSLVDSVTNKHLSLPTEEGRKFVSNLYGTATVVALEALINLVRLTFIITFAKVRPLSSFCVVNDFSILL